MRIVLPLLLAAAALSSGCPIVVTCRDVPCPFGEICNAESGECEVAARNCLEDESICRSGEVCDELTGQCRPQQLRCGEQFAQCPAGQACNAALGRCEPAARCEADADCGAAESCNLATRACEPKECAAPEDCPIAYICGDEGRCVPGCIPSTDGCPSQQFCLVVSGDQTGRCVPNCRLDTECPFGQVCDIATAPNARCIPEDPCSLDGDCRADEICDAGVCRQPPCSADADCLASQVCDTAEGACVDALCDEDVYGAQSPSNTSMETAFGLAPGDYTELRLCSGRSDWFALDVRSTDIVRLRTQQDPGESDLDLFVYDRSGNSLAADEQLGSISSVKFAAPREQTVFVEVRPRDFEAIAYDLTISTEFCDNDAFEENDSRGDPTIIPGSVGVPSELALRTCGFDEDWFRIAVPTAENELTIRRSGGSQDLRVELLTPDGERFVVPRESPRVLHRVGVAGNYLVKAFGTLGQNGAYRLVFNLEDPWNCPGVAAHSTPQAALPAARDETTTEGLCPLAGAWEIDWLALDVDTPGSFEATVRPQPGTPKLDVALVQYDGSETTLVRRGVLLDGAFALQAELDPTQAHFLRITSSEPIGRIIAPPTYDVVWSYEEF